MSKFFNLVGSPLTLPTIIGYHNLTEEQKEELNWEEDDFADPKAQPFWYFDGSLQCEEQDLEPVRQYFHVLSGSEWEYFLSPCYAVKFDRDHRGLPTSVIIQEVSRADLVLPDVLSDYEATQCVEELSKHEYGNGFEAEPCRVSQVIKDLAGYSSMNDADFDALRSEPFESEILPKLFEDCRNSKINDLQDVLSKFFDTHLGRTL